MRQVGKKSRTLVRNAAQVVAYNSLFNCLNLIWVWARGVGKTTEIADFLGVLVHDMPRGVTNIIVPSYAKFLKEMLPSLRLSLEKLGYFEGLHFFIGRRPPKNWNWPTPYMQPDDYTHIIYWYTGHINQIISQDVKGSGRALSVDAEIRDEAAMLNKAVLDETSAATLRGSNVKEFRHKRTFGLSLTATSMPLTLSGQWVLEMEQLALESPKLFNFSMFNVGVNLRNLMSGYVENAWKKALFEWIFKAEYLNEIPNLVLGAFYSLLREDRHGYIPILNDYRSYEDCRYDYGPDNLKSNIPLILGIDWGARINCMTVNQLSDEKEGRVLRALNEFHALGDDSEIQSDMVAKFIEYYSIFPTKRVILFYDRTGNNKTGNTRETRAQEMETQLIKAGWKVERGSKGGSNPFKYLVRSLWEVMLKEDDYRIPKFRINLLKCRNLLISMQNTQTKETKDKQVTKNKSSERANSNIHPTHATDFSDAQDQVVTGICGDEYKLGSILLPKMKTT
jgi:hypothetical protein